MILVAVCRHMWTRSAHLSLRHRCIPPFHAPCTPDHVAVVMPQLALQKCGDLPAEMLRLFVGGRELLSDSALVSEVRNECQEM